MITFIEENNCIFAVEQNVERNGKFYDELWFAEIEQRDYDIVVIWQDDWQNPEKFMTLHDAKSWVILNAKRHTPMINGAHFDL